MVDVSHYKFAGDGGAGAPDWVRAAPRPDDYRGRYGRAVRDRADRYAGHVRDGFRELDAAGHGAAAFLAESILSCGGQIEPPAGYLRAAYRHARAAGALCRPDSGAWEAICGASRHRTSCPTSSRSASRSETATRSAR
jgi:4-aminobutyrate aminotransferase-like enzyme